MKTKTSNETDKGKAIEKPKTSKPLVVDTPPKQPQKGRQQLND